MYSTTRRSTSTARARYAPDGRLLALVADADPGPLAFLDVPEGTPPLTREQITEHIAGLDDEALAAVIDAARAEAEGIDPATATSETVDRINALGDAVEAAETRQEQLAHEDEERQAAAQAALDRVRPPAPPEGDGEGAEGGEPEGGSGADGGAAAPPGDGAREPEPIAAGGAPTPPARRRSPGSPGALPRPGNAGGMGSGTPAGPGAPPAYAPPRATVALVASTGLDAVLPGGNAVPDTTTIGNLFAERLEQVRRGLGAEGQNLSCVQVRTQYPEERRLVASGIDTNTRRVREATTREALVAAGRYAETTHRATVAAGGLCGPIEQLNDVPVLGSTARPFRDAMTNFGADRGGVKWREHISFGDMAGAVGFWTLADDAAVTGDPATEPRTKPCLEVECPDEADAYVEAITLCLLFSNVTSRFDPEGTAANVQAAQIAHARIAENRLMSQVRALSTTVTGGEVLGTTRDLLTFIDNLLAQYRSFFRLDDGIALRWMLPAWVQNQLVSDLTRGMSGELEALAVAEATIAGWFQRRGVNIGYHLDGLTAAIAGGAGAPAVAAQVYGAFTPGGAVARYPAQIEGFMWVEGDMLHLDGGTLDLGVVRDSTLNNVNRYKTFSESWEGVAHRGVEAIRTVLTTRPIGMVAGTADTAAILAA